MFICSSALECYPWKWKLTVSTGQIVFSSWDQKGDHLSERCFPPVLRLNDWHNEQTVLVYCCSGRLDSKWLAGIITHKRNTKAQIPPRTKTPPDSWVQWPDKLVNLSRPMEKKKSYVYMMTKQDLGLCLKISFWSSRQFKSTPSILAIFFYVEALCCSVTIVGHGYKLLVFWYL